MHPFPAPKLSSPNVATLTSLSNFTGTLNSSETIFASGTSIQPGMFGNYLTIPLIESICPGKPNPIPPILLISLLDSLSESFIVFIIF